MLDALDVRRREGDKETAIFKVNIDVLLAKNEPIQASRLEFLAGMVDNTIFLKAVGRDKGSSLKSGHSACSGIEDAPVDAPYSTKVYQLILPSTNRFGSFVVEVPREDSERWCWLLRAKRNAGSSG